MARPSGQRADPHPFERQRKLGRAAEAAKLVASAGAPPRKLEPFRDPETTGARGSFADVFLTAMGADDLAAIDEAREARAAHYERYSADPVAWVREVAGGFVWSKQIEIMESVRDHRHTAVHSCHTIGKSKVAALICAWWIDSHPPGEAFVLTSATTESQIKAVLWRELSRVQTAAQLPGRMTQAEWYMKMPSGKEELVAFGRKPADNDSTAMHGIHAKYVLVVFDEAYGIADPLWEAADSLVSNVYSRFLAIGNPLESGGEFEKVCRPGSGWNAIGISAFDTPNFTGEDVPDDLRHLLVSRVWQQERLKKWGETNPFYLAKVLGQFPETTSGGLIPARWVNAAQQFDVDEVTKTTPVPLAPIELGVDVGGGGDKTTIALRHGNHVRIIYRGQDPSTMSNLGRVIQFMEEHRVTCAKVDEVGLGKGVIDRAKEMANDQRLSPQKRALARCIIGINAGSSPNDRDSYANLRAESYWRLRERFQASANGDWENGIDIDPDDEDLAAQLVDLSYDVTSHGKYQIESKQDMKRRGKSSPDDADAVMLAFCDGIRRKRGGTWGRRDRGLR